MIVRLKLLLFLLCLNLSEKEGKQEKKKIVKLLFPSYFALFHVSRNRYFELLTLHLICRFWPFNLPTYSISICGEVYGARKDLPNRWCMFSIPCDIQYNLFFPITFMFFFSLIFNFFPLCIAANL